MLLVINVPILESTFIFVLDAYSVLLGALDWLRLYVCVTGSRVVRSRGR